MNKKLIVSSVSSFLLALPVMALAFDPGNIPSQTQNVDINGLIDIIFSIIWPVAVAFFIIMFVIAAFLFASAQGDPEKVKKARDAVIWGAVGVVVALIAFSIVFIIRTRVGV